MDARRAGAVALLCAAALGALDSAARGAPSAEEIVARRHELEVGARRWEDRYRRMVIRERGGLKREVEVCERRESETERWSLAFLLRPGDHRGEAFLVKRAADRRPQRYIYFPWQRHPRQISSSDEVPSFVGADLDTHDLEVLQDIERWGPADVRAELDGEATVDGVACYVLELMPRHPDSVYQRLVVWLGKEDLLARRTDLYVDGTTPRRRVLQTDIRAVGSIPVPHRIDVETPDAQSRTIIDVVEAAFDRRIPRTHFEASSLERGRCQ